MGDKQIEGGQNLSSVSPCQVCCSNGVASSLGMSRRHFLQGLSVAGAAMGALRVSETAVGAHKPKQVRADQPFPRGDALRVKPVLVYDIPKRREKSSWRNYGAVQTPAAVRDEVTRIENELHQLQQTAEFPVQVQPLEQLDSQTKLAQLDVDSTDLCLVYAAGYVTQWPLQVPMIMFVRHRSGPFYLGFEIAHWRFLRGSGDRFVQPGFDIDDVVVDSGDELLWRLRAMYGLKNSRGTKMLSIGGMAAYSDPAQQYGPRVAKEIWGYDFVNVDLLLERWIYTQSHSS